MQTYSLATSCILPVSRVHAVRAMTVQLNSCLQTRYGPLLLFPGSAVFRRNALYAGSVISSCLFKPSFVLPQLRDTVTL